MTDPPRRLFDDPETADALREAIDAGRAELPSEAQLDALAAKLGPLLGPPGGGGGGGGSGGPPVDPTASVTATGSIAAKALGGLGLAAAGIAAVVLATRPADDASPRPAPPPVEAPATAEAPPAPAPLPEGVDVPEDVAVPDEPAPPRAGRAGPRHETDPAAELALIREAQAALRATPGEALRLAEEHARRFGVGTLGQEREVVAIDALHRLGRDADARSRADAFTARWPRSAHRRRIDVILGQ